MSDRFERSILALAQPADVQLSLFPDFVCKADELALDFEEGLGEVSGSNSTLDAIQRAAVDELDGLIISMSGQENAFFWTEEAIRSHPTWEEIRAAATRVVSAFAWEMRRPPPSEAIYIAAG